jgi:isoleucyl-tRNA synthetase
MQPALAALKTLDPQQAVRELRETGKLFVSVNGERITLAPEDVEVEASASEGFVAAEDRGYVAVLETALTPELLAEGLARDLTHMVQDVRKRAGLAIENSITLWLEADAEMTEIIRRFQSYLQEETLAATLHLTADGVARTSAYSETIAAAKLGGHEVTVTLRKA